ncbi:nucleoside hydrolase [Ketogulonicigenium vulgare]|uniref:Inosine/uridine-preferring nucleoside hydrolase n=1 Tax=Ketogulonicigenium vulgare (strain WSH-001) TaxID=759362 RepID=F9Y3P6_KETVW|nr:nucleoside hydrolase [Ketogulonicigenium vulgare]ADO42208.1 inosine/uridine-preferring nucleoside hydrolase [Ketogulonicigenium vulgare Y25]AEM40410.1 Inosine/uridine-preferring nucleoside hydrolase [Ketogulonicigenium vulgare WSH-001]ALJ80599.1 nucleoside hydrolase [Ketogulonicigenium vulgare]AOZ54125.1 inosine/uridine-preferring nucleoside hydrolase [Ketogulonicigenium vulgare]
MRNPVIFDSDGGVDDAQALQMLLAGGVVPMAITSVFGNVSLAAATRNLLTVLEVTGHGGVPVYTGAAVPMVQPVIDATHIHGEDGLGGAPRPASIPAPAGDDAVTFLRETFRNSAANGTKTDIIMIGPLTNLALALRLEPAITAGIGRLTIMGATVYGRGNTTPAAEFNICADPEAAAVVFQADIDTIVVPWEPCTTHFISRDAARAMIAAEAPSFVRDFSSALLEHACKTDEFYGGDGKFKYVDPFAIAVYLNPDLVIKTIKASVDVSLALGITRGMTVVDPSGRLGTPMITLVETGDVTQLTAAYKASISYHA